MSGGTNVGLSFDELLEALIAAFPENNWTSDDLEIVLSNGISRGLFRFHHELDSYFVNQNLLNINPQNWIYEEVCPKLCAKKQCRAPSNLKVCGC